MEVDEFSAHAPQGAQHVLQLHLPVGGQVKEETGVLESQTHGRTPPDLHTKGRSRALAHEDGDYRRQRDGEERLRNGR